MASTKIGGIKPLSGMRGTHLTKGTTSKSSIPSMKIPKARKPTVTAPDKFSRAGMAKIKGPKGKRVVVRNIDPYASPAALGPLYKKRRTRKSTTMQATAPRVPKRRRKKTVG